MVTRGYNLHLVTDSSLIADLVRETTCVSFRNLLDITFASDCMLTVSAEFVMTKSLCETLCSDLRNLILVDSKLEDVAPSVVIIRSEKHYLIPRGGVW